MSLSVFLILLVLPNTDHFSHGKHLISVFTIVYLEITDSKGEIIKGVLPLILQYYHPNLGASLSSTISEHYLAGALKQYMPAKDCGALN